MGTGEGLVPTHPPIHPRPAPQTQLLLSPGSRPQPPRQGALRMSAPNACPQLVHHKPLIWCSWETPHLKEGRLSSFSPDGEEGALGKRGS